MKALTMDRAGEYASWFHCLSDGTRVQILSVVAGADEPLTVGEIVDAVGKSQSTVSRHLQILASQRFVITEPDGVRTLVRVNPECMTALPDAAAADVGDFQVLHPQFTTRHDGGPHDFHPTTIRRIGCCRIDLYFLVLVRIEQADALA